MLSGTSSDICNHGLDVSEFPPVTNMETEYQCDFEHFSKARDSIEVMAARNRSSEPARSHRGSGIGKLMFWSKKVQIGTEVLEKEAEKAKPEEDTEDEAFDPSDFQVWRVRDSIDIMRTRSAAWQAMRLREMGPLRRIVYKLWH